ncbi:serine hydrolase domain-containing protein [Nocardia rhizosphaerihabitans]|uniref:serine hydrolase domain-containing protein n=1 Tax=Nocardia rhizosphaerihabitans TaxID=1691570 RepID=UPI00367146BC
MKLSQVKTPSGGCATPRDRCGPTKESARLLLKILVPAVAVTVTLAGCSSGNSIPTEGSPSGSVAVGRGGSQTLPNGEVVATDIFNPTSENQEATIRNYDKIPGVNTRAIPADPSKSKPIERSEIPLGDISFILDEEDRNLDYYFEEFPIGGLLVLKDGKIAYERYGLGNNDQTRWTSMSIAKSVTSTLVGAAIKDGLIGSLQDPITKYLPELNETPYKDNTIQQLLRMSSGIRWDEWPYETVEAGGKNDISKYFAAFNSQDPNAMMNLMKSVSRTAPPGSRYNYNTGDYFLLTEVLSRATGKTVSDYFSEKIWKPAGMEKDGFWLLDSPDGGELGGTGFSATLRDYGRYGQFILNGAPGTVPDGWFKEAARPSSANGGEYGYGWKGTPASAWASVDNSPNTLLPFGHTGIYGQKLYIIPEQNIVIVQWGAYTAKEQFETQPEAAAWTAVREAIVAKLK